MKMNRKLIYGSAGLETGTKLVTMFLVVNTPTVAPVTALVYVEGLDPDRMIYSKSISKVVPAGAATVNRPLSTKIARCHAPSGVVILGVRARYAGISMLAEVSIYFSGTPLNRLLLVSCAKGCKEQVIEVPWVVMGHNIRIFLIRTASMKQFSKVVEEANIN